MHYQNGREAKNGDVIVHMPKYGKPAVGILYGATVGNDYCNGEIAQMRSSDPMANLSECLHIDDVKTTLEMAFSKPAAAPTEPHPSAEIK